MDVTIGKYSPVDADPLDCARLVASLYHFYDVDIEPMEPGRVRLTARAHRREVRFNGTSVRDVCERFVNSIMSEVKNV